VISIFYIQIKTDKYIILNFKITNCISTIYRQDGKHEINDGGTYIIIILINSQP